MNDTVEIPEELFHAIKQALNEVTNTPLDHDDYPDTYSIADALDDIEY